MPTFSRHNVILVRYPFSDLSDSKDLETIFQTEVKKNPWIEQHLAVGEFNLPGQLIACFTLKIGL